MALKRVTRAESRTRTLDLSRSVMFEIETFLSLVLIICSHTLSYLWSHLPFAKILFCKDTSCYVAEIMPEGSRKADALTGVIAHRADKKRHTKWSVWLDIFDNYTIILRANNWLKYVIAIIWQIYFFCFKKLIYRFFEIS